MDAEAKLTVTTTIHEVQEITTAEAVQLTGTAQELVVAVQPQEAAAQVPGSTERNVDALENPPESNGALYGSAHTTSADGDDAVDNAAVAEQGPAKKSRKRGPASKKGSRKGGKKTGGKSAANGKKLDEDLVQITQVPAASLEDKQMVLSVAHKAAQVTLSEDKLSATSWKGYRMVRATRGVAEGAWYFEISVEHLGKTGHTRLGWSTQGGDVQAPVGYDGNSYAYRDLEGVKVHEALRQPYAEAYMEGDVIGCYISLPGGEALAPKPRQVMRWKGQPYYIDEEEGLKQMLPGSEVAFFKNGICQGTAFADIFAGRYYPAASIYTLPEQTEKATVQFNFGPSFAFPPTDWGHRPVPNPMSDTKPIELPIGHPEELATNAVATTAVTTTTTATVTVTEVPSQK